MFRCQAPAQNTEAWRQQHEQPDWIHASGRGIADAATATAEIERVIIVLVRG